MPSATEDCGPRRRVPSGHVWCVSWKATAASSVREVAPLPVFCRASHSPARHVVETRGRGIFRTEKPLPRIHLLSDRRRARVTHRALFFFLLRNRQIDIWSPVRLTIRKNVCFVGGDKTKRRSAKHERGGIRSVYIAFFSLGREGKKGSRLRRSLGSLQYNFRHGVETRGDPFYFHFAQ